ncbi:phosphoribosylaminoimidazolesuccinocarboxamide synthase [bacterium]|nr:MAG: phosphoribosylaminoimidazolesuccinocarboxamide synthase [bacterium]
MEIEYPEILGTNLGRPPDFSGKVRDVYDLDDRLLLVATDRLSAYDCILPNGIPGRGRVLTEMSVFWFDRTKEIIPNHLISADIADFPDELKRYREQIEGRSMLCMKAERIDVECVARGYLAGSGWREYKRLGTVCGIKLPDGLRESEKLPEPIFTPATKAEQGTHDENISFDRLTKIVDPELAETLRDLTLRIYSAAANYAISRGVIISDTKFEFGYIDGKLSVIDEMLSPDSSRFWDVDEYEPGRPQNSFDKQFVRDWLTSVGFNGDGEPPTLPEDIVAETIARYREIRDRLISG